jgi:hypothetical protein
VRKKWYVDLYEQGNNKPSIAKEVERFSRRRRHRQCTERPLRARSGQSGMALGEITAHFVATIHRSLLSAVEGGTAEKPSCSLLSTKTCHDLGTRDCSSVKRNRSNPSTFGPFAFG